MRLIGLIISALVMTCVSAHAETVMDRVNKTNAIRCGYVEYSPALVKDLKTGQWHGFDYEIIKAIGDRLQLKIDYTAPTGWGTVVTDLNAKKFDMLCSGFWVHPNVGKFALFTRPAFYQPVFVVARADDTRFNKDANLNDPKLKMVSLDGDNPVHIAKSDFPLAQILTLPNMTDYSQIPINVADGKADFTIIDAYAFGAYNKNNPGKLKIVTPDKPIRIYPVSYVVSKEDTVLRDAIDAALNELILDGSISRILDRYDEFPNSYYRAVIPYALGKAQ
jgi:ABC-type amino acid transport substrate-binding protein